MKESLKITWFYGISALFILISIIMLVTVDNGTGVLAALVPFALVFIFITLFSFDKILLLLGFLVPLSVNIDDIGLGLGISLPAEPLVMVLTGLVVFRFIIDGEYDYRIFKHPITIAMLVNLGWMLITTLTSEMPLVSWKFFLSRFWFVVVFYFLYVPLFRKLRNVNTYLWLYIIPLAGVILFTLYKHSAFGFILRYSYEIMKPFYVAHGVYAAAIAFCIPMIFIYTFFHKAFGIKRYWFFIMAGVLVIFSIGLYFSYTRAAWLSVLVAAFMVLPILFKIKLRTLVVTLGIVLTVGLTFRYQIEYSLSKNEQESDNGFLNHLQSSSNISSDASNTERINRWVSAYNMFLDKPVFGFGPGTYMFKYAPYQEARWKTIISTNFGNGGNSHSEYLNPLSESGLFGMISLLILLYVVFNRGMDIAQNAANKLKVRLLSTGIILGLTTYFVHGFMNNYSDMDKVAALIWTGMAIITSLDLYHSGEKEKEDQKDVVTRELQ